MRTSHLIALAALGVSMTACVSEEPIALPDLSGHRTLLVRVTSQGVEKAYALDLSTAPITLPIGLDSSSAAELLLVAFDATLAELKLSEGPVELAKDNECGRHLAAPIAVWTGRIDAGRSSAWMSASTDVLTSLRIASKRGSCPNLDRGRAMWPHLRCARNDCHANITQTYCELAIDTAQCGYGELRGEIGANGELCFVPSPALGVCDAVPSEDPLLTSIVCSGASGPSCTIDVVGDVTERPFTVSKTALWDASPIVDPDLSRVGGGYLRDIVVRDDELLVVGSPVLHDFWTCGANLLYTVSTETLSLVRTATLPDCLNHIRPDPLGDGFVGVWGRSAPVIGRFDRRGRLLAEVRYTGDPGDQLAPTGLAVSLGPDPVAVVSLSDNVSVGHGSQIFAAELSTMTELPHAPELDGVVNGVEPFDERQVLIIDSTRRTIWLFDPRTRARIAGPTTQGTATGSEIGIGRYNPAADMFLLTVNEQSGGVFAFARNFDRLGHVWPYERFANVWGLGPWPTSPTLSVVSMVSYGGGYEASVALFDPTVPRFLPSAETVGIGPIYRMVADDRGRVFALLAWLPEIARIDPNPRASSASR